MVKQGDIVWLDFDPQTGHEQKGRRPALVVSNSTFGKIMSGRMAMICPITNTNRSFPLQVELPQSNTATGVIMCEQAKVLDIKARNAEKFDEVSEEVLNDVLDIISNIISKENNVEF